LGLTKGMEKPGKAFYGGGEKKNRGQGESRLPREKAKSARPRGGTG